jgi:flagellar biosynthetic protein FliR
MDLSLAQDYATSLFLHVVRVGAFVAVLPLFGRQRDSLMLRLALSTALGAIFWWVGDQRIETPASLLALGGMAVREGVVGFALGFALSTMTSMLVSAGEFISSEMGFSLARALNPETGVSVTVISQLLQILGVLLIFQFDLHHELLRVLEQTFHSCRVGEPFDFLPIWSGVAALVSGSVQVALQYSFPVLGIMLLVSVGMVLLGRAVPAINLMDFGFALRVLLAIGALAVFLGESVPFLVRHWTTILERAFEMFPV